MQKRALKLNITDRSQNEDSKSASSQNEFMKRLNALSKNSSKMNTVTTSPSCNILGLENQVTFEDQQKADDDRRMKTAICPSPLGLEVIQPRQLQLGEQQKSEECQSSFKLARKDLMGVKSSDNSGNEPEIHKNKTLQKEVEGASNLDIYQNQSVDKSTKKNSFKLNLPKILVNRLRDK